MSWSSQAPEGTTRLTLSSAFDHAGGGLGLRFGAGDGGPGLLAGGATGSGTGGSGAIISVGMVLGFGAGVGFGGASTGRGGAGCRSGRRTLAATVQLFGRDEIHIGTRNRL